MYVPGFRRANAVLRGRSAQIGQTIAGRGAASVPYPACMTVRPQWFVVIDSQKARLLRGSRTTKGSPHLEEMAALSTTFAAGEHQRPDRLGAPGRSAGFANERDEAVAHFARQVAPWLTAELARHSVGSCALFAPAHTLGALRKELPGSLTGKLAEHAVELAGLPIAQLAEHPRIVALLGS